MSRLKLLTSSVSLLALALASMGIYSACATTSTHGLSTLRTTGPCTLFPPDNWWRQDISKLPVHPMSAKYVDSIGPAKGLHPDFGTVWNGAPNGIPFRVVSARTPRVKIVFTRYGNESDPGPYPMPLDSPIEGGPKGTADRHVIAFDPGA